jgi:hypothetical protein
MPTPEEILAARLRGKRPAVDDLYGRLEELRSNPVDYSQFQEAGRQRTDASRRDAMAGMALQALGGRAFAPTGGAVLKQALGGFDPQKLGANEVGYFDPSSGQFVENPLASRQREEKFLTGRIDRRTAEELRREQMQNSAAARAASLAQAGYYKNAALQLAERKATAAAVPKPLKGAVSQSGGPVFVSPDNQFVDREGNPTVPLTPAVYEKGYQAQVAGDAALGEVNKMLKSVEDNPGAYGYIARGSTLLPRALGSELRTRALSKEERKTRAAVGKQAYNVIKQLAGAALSMGEEMRIDPFVPGPTDTSGDVMTKLSAARDEYMRITANAAKSGARYGRPSAAPAAPAVPAAPAAPAGPGSPDDDALINKYLGGGGG